jgi:hypothetical protein
MALFLVLAGCIVASMTHAEGLVGHSVSYDVKPLKELKDIYIEGQASVTLARDCTNWTLGEVFQLGVEREAGAVGRKALSSKAERIEERVSAQELIDGSTLRYQTRLRSDARIDTTTGTASLGREAGTLHAVMSRFKQDTDLPAGTLGPAAARAALLKALAANQLGKIQIRTVDMLRFHKPILQIFTPLQPEDPSISRSKPKDLHVSDKDFAKGLVWALRRQVPEFNEFGDEFWLLHESGTIVRQIITRQGIQLMLEARDITLFPPPTCP